MFQDNFYYNEWLDPSSLNDNHCYKNSDKIFLPVSLDLNFFKSLKFDKQSLNEYRIEAATECAKHLGDNPALCFSGGVDSQAMVQCFAEAHINYKAYFFVFNNGLNLNELTFARKYCALRKIDLIEIPFNVISFLNRENYEYGIKYSCTSPHFNTHYAFANYLQSIGHTGVCFGGITPYKNLSDWGSNFERNVLNYINYTKVSKFYCQGNFLSFYPKLSWAIALNTPASDIDPTRIANTFRETELLHAIRYANKIMGYYRSGFDIIENRKMTGFEEVKDYLHNKTGNGLEFEERFRMPLEKYFSFIINKSKQISFKYLPEVKEFIDFLHFNNK